MLARAVDISSPMNVAHLLDAAESAHTHLAENRNCPLERTAGPVTSEEASVATLLIAGSVCSGSWLAVISIRSGYISVYFF